MLYGYRSQDMETIIYTKPVWGISMKSINEIHLLFTLAFSLMLAFIIHDIIKNVVVNAN